MPKPIRESTGTVTKTGGRRFNSRLIEGDRWGSSGYYSKKVLERDGPTTWPVGTQIYLDHPGVTENYDRPERSVKDLAGKIISTPAYESDGLYADVEFYPHYAPIIEAMWEDVGMSIRASATVENGEAGGRRGPIIQSLEGGLSVDVVTKAGAGGKLVSLLESARESAPVTISEATANDTREWLQAAVRARLGGEEARWAWVRDFDDTNVWYEADGEDDATHTYQQGYTLSGNTAELTGDPVEVRAETKYVPIAAAPATESQNSPSNPAGVTNDKEAAVMATTNIEEAELATLKESSGRVPALEAELAEARTKLAEAETARTKATAEAIVAEAFGDTEAKVTRAALITAALAAEAFDADKLRADATEAAAEIAVTHGAGTPRGLGDTITESKTITDDDIVNAL